MLIGADNAAVDAFHKSALESGAKDNGAPRFHDEMSVQPYYSGFVIDPDGNNVEAVAFEGEQRRRNR